MSIQSDFQNVWIIQRTSGLFTTFQSCPINFSYYVEDEEDRSTRECEACGKEEGFSQGYFESECYSCEDLEVGIESADPLSYYFF